MAAKPKSKQKKQKEVRFLICKGCKGGIDEMGCGAICKYDTLNFEERDPATMEYYIYVFDRTEPYQDNKKRKKNF